MATQPRAGGHASNHPDYKVTLDGELVHRGTGYKATQSGSTVKVDKGGNLYT